jgi:signal transduction histidine kinase
VVLTGLDDEAVAVRAMGEGAQDFLVKGHVDGQLSVRAIRYAIERQQLATALIQTRQQQLEMKDRSLSHVSHEFRTPLIAILWYARHLFGVACVDQMVPSRSSSKFEPDQNSRPIL